MSVWMFMPLLGVSGFDINTAEHRHSGIHRASDLLQTPSATPGVVLNNGVVQAKRSAFKMSYLTSEVLVNNEVTKAMQEYYLRSHGQFASVVDVVGIGGSSLIWVQASLLLFAILGSIYVYSRNIDSIEARTGLRLTHVCCICYAALSILIDLSIKNAAVAYGGAFPFNPACCVAVVEFGKFFISAVFLAYRVLQSRSQGLEILLPTVKDALWLSVPALFYALNNLIVFQAIKSTPLATFGVLRETMLIWSAIIWTITFQHPVSTRRWLSIAGIFLGCCVNQIPIMLKNEWTPGVIWSLLLAFCVSAAGVANEYAMKQRAALDINLQNCVLYFICTMFVLLGIAICEPEYIFSSSRFFTGFVPQCWQVIILQVFAGLAVSRILKYVEAVTKTIVAAIRGPGVLLLGTVLFHTSLGVTDVVATLVVCISVWVYLREGPLLVFSAPPQKDTAMETDTLLGKKPKV